MTAALLFASATMRVRGCETDGAPSDVETNTRCTGVLSSAPSGRWTKAPSLRKAVLRAVKPLSWKPACWARCRWTSGPSARTASARLAMRTPEAGAAGGRARGGGAGTEVLLERREVAEVGVVRGDGLGHIATGPRR